MAFVPSFLPISTLLQMVKICPSFNLSILLSTCIKIYGWIKQQPIEHLLQIYFAFIDPLNFLLEALFFGGKVCRKVSFTRAVVTWT